MPETSESPFLTLGVACSPNDRESVRALVSALPAHDGWACVLVPTESTSASLTDLVTLLSRGTELPVQEVATDTPLQANTLFVIPPGRPVTLRNGSLVVLETSARDDRATGPVDGFFVSLARELGPTAAVAVLSASGTDGVQGLRAVAAAGGIVVAQDPGLSPLPELPRSALETGCIRAIGGPASLPDSIRGARQEFANAQVAAQPPSPHESVAEKHGHVLEMLRARHGLDFAQYRPATVERRIRRHMTLLECDDPDAYVERLRSDPKELDRLRHDLLSGVTDFFREPDALETLRSHVKPGLAQHGPRGEFRAWCAGCSTGEEAYSIAILLDELARETGFSGRILLFATDAHAKAVDVASAGRYDASRLGGLGDERLKRYFQPASESQYRIHPELRAQVVFTTHDLLVDPPFTRIDLVVCRNLLVHLEPDAQDRVLQRFHQALRTNGLLFLGSGESAGRLAGEFMPLDSRHKIYRKIGDRRFALPSRRTGMSNSPFGSSGATGQGSASATTAFSRRLLRAYDHLLYRHAPPGFLADSNGVLLHCFGDAGRLLLPPEGRVENNLLTRTTGELRVALATLLPRARRSQSPVAAQGVRVALPGQDPEIVNLVAELIPDVTQDPALIHIAVARAPDAAQLAPANIAPGVVTSAPGEDRIAVLETELQSTKDNLHSTVEQLQVAQEKLKATNEELLAADEALQAANDEIDSLNEELLGLNNEFGQRNLELQQLNADLDNLLGALEIGTIFLDRDLRIRKFNTAIERCFRLLPQDIGRPISHIAYQLDDQTHLLSEISRVLATGSTARREIRSRDGQFFLKRILPFRNSRGEIDGVVLTFADITAVRHMQDRFDLAIEASRLVWWDWDIAHDHLATHAAGWCILGYDLEVISRTGAGWLGLVHPEDQARVRESLDAALRGDLPVWDCEHRFKSRSGAWLWVANKGRVTERDPHGKPLRMLGTTQDIDARKNAEVAVARDLELLAHVPDAVICVDPSGVITYWNQAATDLYGWEPNELIGRPVTERLAAHAQESIARIIAESLAGRDFNGELEDTRKDGSRVWVEARTHRLLDQEGRVFGIMGISRDITEARRQREERARIERQLAQSQKMETLGNLAGGIAHDFNNLLAAILGYSEIATGLLPEDHPALAKLANVRNAGQRAAELVRRILAFSRAGEQPRRPVSIAQVVEETLPLLRASLPSTIQIRSRVAPDADQTVLGDHTQLQQVLLNLCTNSAQAIGERTGGRLDITLEPVMLETPPPLHVGAIVPGPALLLCVADNGAGIPEEILERVFEPFFTTKPIGEGTGLGLSIVHSIIAAHGGGIHITSSPGVGTRFAIYLPALSPALESAPIPSSLRTNTSAFPCGHGERVAVIDDEESVALLTQQALERYGYSAEIMPDAPTCLEILRAKPDAFALVVTDQTMPLMTGLELVQELRSANIQTPVILLSGYSRALDPALLPGLGRVGFLAKPFVLADLLEHVHAIVRPPAT